MTSNAKSAPYPYRAAGSRRLRVVKREVLESSSAFRPEFLNRVDDVVVFHPLTRKHLRDIVDIQLQRLQARLTDRQLVLEFTDAAKDWLAERGYDPVYGARPLKRTVQSTVETPIAHKIIAGEINEGDRLRVDVGGGGLVFVPAAGTVVEQSGTAARRPR